MKFNIRPRDLTSYVNMLFRCWPDFELQHELVKVETSVVKTGNLFWQGTFLLRIIQKNVLTHKFTEKRRKMQKKLVQTISSLLKKI